MPGSEFTVYRSTTLHDIGKRLTKRAIKKGNFTDIGVDFGKTYYYRVLNEKGELSQPATAYVNPYRANLGLLPTAYIEKKGVSGLTANIMLAYYIGSLYSRNKIHEIYESFFFLRTGLWLAILDFKLTPFIEEKNFFNISIGMRWTYFFTDIPPPGAGMAEQAFTFRMGQGKNISGVYISTSKRLPKIIIHSGMILGREGGYLTYLFNERVRYYKTDLFDDIAFFGIETKLIPHFPLKFEVLFPLENEMSFFLINTDLSKILPIGFHLSFLKYNEGFQILAFLRFYAAVFTRPR